jgi:hypothetical protein
MNIHVSQVCTVFNKSPILTHDGANAKFGTNWDEMDYSIGLAEINSSQKRKSLLFSVVFANPLNLNNKYIYDKFWRESQLLRQ